MTADECYEEYAGRLLKACEDPQIRIAVKRAIASFRSNIDEAFLKFPKTVEKRKQARRVKEYSIGHLEELAKQARDSIEDMMGNCYIARSSGDALKYLDSVIGADRLVVKSKSITSEEIGLNEHLEAKGNSVLETDLGEFIVQQLHEKPMHILSPSIHVPRERVAELFSRLIGRKLKPEIPVLVKAARAFLRDIYQKADVGISGANAVAAETGTVFIIENEGNARFVTNAPPMHIVLAGFEKLVPTLADAMLVAEVTWRYASYKAPSYISLISGPSKTGDIEKAITYGAQGPGELHVILLDNGRTSLAKDPTYREALYCTKCGSCLYECPIFSVAAGAFGHKYFGGVGAVWTAFIAGGLDKALPMVYSCTLCGRCKDHCPMEIDTAAMVSKLRSELVSKGKVISPLLKVCESIHAYGNPFGLEAPIEL